MITDHDHESPSNYQPQNSNLLFQQLTRPILDLKQKDQEILNLLQKSINMQYNNFNHKYSTFKKLLSAFKQQANGFLNRIDEEMKLQADQNAEFIRKENEIKKKNQEENKRILRPKACKLSQLDDGLYSNKRKTRVRRGSTNSFFSFQNTQSSGNDGQSQCNEPQAKTLRIRHKKRGRGRPKKQLCSKQQNRKKNQSQQLKGNLLYQKVFLSLYEPYQVTLKHLDYNYCNNYGKIQR